MTYAQLKINLPKKLVVLKLKDDSYVFYTDLDLSIVKSIEFNRKTTNLNFVLENNEIKVRIINGNILKTDKEIYMLSGVKIKDIDKANILNVNIED